MSENQISGEGVLRFPNFIYGGEFSRGLFHGSGELHFDENLFQGHFQSGQPIYGTLFMPNGEYFTGEFKNGRKGYRQYANGHFRGTFDKATQTRSEGIYFWKGCAYSGPFLDGLPHGVGEVFWKKSNSLSTKIREQFKGRFENGIKNGVGILQWQQMTLMAVWQNGVKNGPGLLVAVNGDVFVSLKMFANDKFCGSQKVLLNQRTMQTIRELLLTGVNFDEGKFARKVKMLLQESFDVPTLHTLDYNIDLQMNPLLSFVMEKFPDINVDKELDSLRRAIGKSYFDIKRIYEKYANFEDLPRKDFVMNRLGMWQFFRDLGFGGSSKF